MKDKKKRPRIIICTVLILIALIALGVGTFLMLEKKPTELPIKVKNPKKVPKSPYRISTNALEPFDLYFLQLENLEKNKIYSPLSIKYALEMLGEGTKENSKAQIASIIGSYKAKKYINDQHMSFANVMFIKSAYKDAIKEDFVKNLTDKYNAEVVYDSFKNPKKLNNWLSKKTFKLINNLYNDISDKDFILVNALAIDMEWKNLIQNTIIHPKRTYNVSYIHENFNAFIVDIQNDNYKSMKFNNKDNIKSVEIGAAINNYDIVNTLGEENIRKTVGEEYNKWLAEGGCGRENPDTNTYLNTYIEELNSNYKRVHTSTDFSLYNDNEVKVFAKDLKEYNGTTLQYVGIMPQQTSLSNLIKDIDSKKITTLIDNLKEIKPENFKEGVVTKIIGQIPLFKFDYELKLMDDLKELGITDVFDINKADLSGIVSDRSAVISDVTHKANIEFSNEGIKAVAATGMAGAGSAGCRFEYKYDVPIETIDLTFDKPFMFLIRDKTTGEVWFTGTVYDPLNNE